MRRRLVCAAFVLVSAVSTDVRAKEQPLDTEEAIATAFAAAGPSDRPAILKASEERDRWLIAWWLAAAGDVPAARALAASVSDGGRIAKYLDGPRTAAPAAQRESIRAAERALAAGDGPALEAATGPLEPAGDAFLVAWKGVRLALAAALTHRATGTDAAGGAEAEALASRLADAERQALALGWVEGATRVMFEQASRRLAAGDASGALGHYRRGHALLRDGGLVLRAARALGDVANVLGSLGDSAAALEAYDAALAVLRPAAHRSLARVLRNASAVATAHGAHASAMRFAEEARALALATGRGFDAAVALDRVAAARWRMGDLDGAARDEEAAITSLSTGSPRVERADALGNLGGIARARGDLETAAKLYREAREIFRAAGDDEHDAVVAENLAEILVESGRLDEADLELDRAEAGAKKSGRRDLEADVLRERAAILVARDRASKAGPLLDRALALAEESDSLHLQVRILEARARLALATGSPRRAIVDARAGCRLAAALTRGLADVEASASRAWRSGVHTVGAAAAVALGDTAALLEFLEAGRGGALIETIEGRDAFRRAHVPAALRAAEDQAATEAAIAAREYQAALAGGVLARSREALATLRAARARLRDAAVRRERETRARAGVLSPPAPTTESIQALLAPSHLFVAWAMLGERTAALVIPPKGAPRIVDLGAVADVEPLLEAFHAAASEGASVGPSVGALAARLVTTLAMPADAGRVVVSADARLASLPWPMMIDREVACVPSAAVWMALASRAGPKGDGILALGDPAYPAGARSLPALPRTRDEVMAVGDVKLLGADATKSRLLAALAGRPRWSAVHLACHGLADLAVPTECALALTPSDADDGRWTSLEVLAADIPSDLVVLSACNSGVGAAWRGEGTMSLARAFLAAGAPRVVCSLWKVDDDATATLMREFHRQRNGGKGSAAALRAAQRLVASEKRTSAPRYWAAWILLGLGDG